MNNEKSFEDKTLVEKINTIDAIIDADIRGFLVRDNGDLDLVNVEEKNDLLLVYIEYQGACVSCPSSGGTLMSIQNILQRKLAENIRVLTV
ncbi:MAG: NifU family protein [Epsilonproteobacteria bacterium]|nr:NifU family protein [Campylobacterota bacterium]